MKKSEKTKKAENQQSVNQQTPPRFQVQFDMNYGGTYVTKDGETMTVPDMNLTVRQLLQNHSRGLSNDRHLKDPLYFDIQIPKIKDITDVHEYKAYLENQVNKVEQWLEEEKAEKQIIQEDKEKNQVEKLKNAKQLRIDEELEKGGPGKD